MMELTKNEKEFIEQTQKKRIWEKWLFTQIFPNGKTSDNYICYMIFLSSKV
jgi:hypothetical protein